MARSQSATPSDIVEEIVSLARQRLPAQSATIVPFIRRYFHGVSLRDLGESPINDLYGAAVAHFNLGRGRTPGGAARVHVYNPRLDEHGWQSTHTIVEVVVDDMPFLVDSARIAINRCGHTVHLAIHPVVSVVRDAEGNVSAVGEGEEPLDGANRESFMHFEVDRQTEGAALEALRLAVAEALVDVRTVVEDFGPMVERIGGLLDEIERRPPPLDAEQLSEGRAFLQWLRDGNFTFLGYREHDLVNVDGEDALRIVPDSALGLLRKKEQDGEGGEYCQSFAALSPEARRLARVPELLVINRAVSESTVHRTGHMDYVGVKKFGDDGRVTGEHRFLGLYTSTAYTGDVRSIPILRRKLAGVLARAQYPEQSHSGRALVNILETLPRSELFQISEQELTQTALGILQLQERQRTTLFIRLDPFGRFYSCLVFVPRDQMSTDVRRRIGEILMESLNGRGVEFTVQIAESLLARLHFIVRIAPGAPTVYDAEEIEARIIAATRQWRDHLYDAMLEQCGEEQGTRLFRRYGDAFRADYREAYSPQVAVHDAQKMDQLKGAGDVAMALYRPLEAPDGFVRFKLFRQGSPVPLFETLPMLEHMGLKVVDERPSKIVPPVGPPVWIHDFGMEHGEQAIELDEIKQIFHDAFVRVFRGEVSSDGFNRLTLRAGLDWRRVSILRAYCKYLRQGSASLSQEYMEQALVGNADIARLLVELFEERFDPERGTARDDRAAALEAEIEGALDAVASLDEDRILRSFQGAVSATLRTNYYQQTAGGAAKPYLAFKFDSPRVPDMPDPRPMYEIFVYSPRVEGVHLRGGPVARGGLRWSDRPEDFRTEVLGLVKAQMVKNTVIVPVGSKGGFVPKQLPTHGDREQILGEGIACYRIFISGLLDVTDNFIGGAITPPPRVVRHDGDDPYLVVAADKGTATFSDIANEVAAAYGFWLGDAFASGGSAGYDHKGMGITARGGWESVKRHFRELGLDTQRDDFTVIGIGDMSGDVFGNGMLLSRHIKLVGAFNHQHIFLDPTPDCERSFQERERMFGLARSSWEDYDRTAISAGGGVYRRSAKSIPLSPEVRTLLGLEATALTPNALIRAMLKAPVDLLWNGGIGTYVKASNEQHADVGDRTNNALRIDGRELRCRVVGEGGNLGLTQLGRIEYARHGGHINTDAIDNSGGVDCSDHEVNIKILLNSVMASGDMTLKQRNELLVRMTDEVAQLVLKNNYMQSQVLSLGNAQAVSLLLAHGRLMHALEGQGKLVRALEFLPSDDLLQERKNAGEGLTRPELAVLLAYVKIDLYDRLLASDLPDEPYLERTLFEYFPSALRDGFAAAIRAHQLRRQIVATEVVNGLVNRAGITFVFRIREETGVAEAQIARAYIVAREVYELRALWRQIEALDNQVPNEVQQAMLLDVKKLLERSVRWIIRHRPSPLSVAGEVERYAASVNRLAATLEGHIGEEELAATQQRVEGLRQAGVHDDLSLRVAMVPFLVAGLDLAEIASSTGIDIERVAAGYFQIGEMLDLHWLRDRINELPRDSHWQTMARAALRDDLSDLRKQITASVFFDVNADTETDQLVRDWAERNGTAMGRCVRLMSELRSGPTADFTMLSVALRELRALAQATAPAAADIAAQQRAAGLAAAMSVG